MRVLIIVHLVPEFERTVGVLVMDSLVKKVVRYAKDFDNVINVYSLDDRLFYQQLKPFVQQQWIWGFDYAYYTTDEESKDYWEEGKNWIRTTGHVASEIANWMQALSKKDTYTLVGGARSECLQDVYDIFNHLELKTKIKESLTYD